jgi:hypothetical protein
MDRDFVSTIQHSEYMSEQWQSVCVRTSGFWATVKKRTREQVWFVDKQM